MTNVFIIHGSYGHPSENWFAWLKGELESLGCKVFVPRFPTPIGQNLDSWMKVISKYDNYFDEESIIVGRSMGCALILRKLELLNKPLKAVFLVGAFTKDLLGGEYSSIIDSFFKEDFDWEKIRSNSKKFFVYQSNNDPLVHRGMGEEIAKNLNCEMILVKGAGHFNEEAGYKKFELLLEKINSLL